MKCKLLSHLSVCVLLSMPCFALVVIVDNHQIECKAQFQFRQRDRGLEG